MTAADTETAVSAVNVIPITSRLPIPAASGLKIFYHFVCCIFSSLHPNKYQNLLIIYNLQISISLSTIVIY